MKAYLVTTAAVFGAIVLAHVARLAAEGLHVAGDPVFLLATVLPACLCAWACHLLRRWRAGTQNRA